jgi:hypothetical protein
VSFGANFAIAIKRAVAGWNPAKHPRGRDGKFIEIGDTVKVFSGPSSPQIDSGVVVGGHLYEDGRFFVAVKSATTNDIAWYRPKQIEAMHPKADLAPKIPLPDIGNKMAMHVDWEDEDLAALKYSAGYTLDTIKKVGTEKETGKLAAEYIKNPASIIEATDAVVAEVLGKDLTPADKAGNAYWSPPTSDKPLAMDPIVPSGGAWKTLVENHADWDTIADDVGLVDDPGYAFAKNGVDIHVYDLGLAAQSISTAIDTQMSYGDADEGDATSLVLIKVLDAKQAIDDAKAAKQAGPATPEQTLKKLATPDPPLEEWEKALYDPPTPAPAPAPKAPSVPAPIKLPKDKSAAQTLDLIFDSAFNKKLPEPVLKQVLDNLNAAKNEPDFQQAHKYLATAMTLAKLGGKQRARYKAILAMHHGVAQPAESKPVPPLKPTNGFGAVLAEPPPGAKVPTLAEADAWVYGTGSPGGAKKKIQMELAERLKHIPAAEWAKILWDSPGHSDGGTLPLKNAYTGNTKSTDFIGGAILYLEDTGNWTPKPANMAAYPGATTMAFTKENIEKAMRETAVSHLIASWAATSNDDSVRSLTIQEAAKEEFGLPDDWIYQWHNTPAYMAKHRAMHMKTYRAFLRAMYTHTQEELAKTGWTHIRLRRGVSAAPKLRKPSGGTTVLSTKGAKGSIIQRPLSSTAANQSTVNKFGYHQVEMIVPIDRIVGSALTGFGCQNEYEYVMIGGVNEVVVHKNGY